MVARDPERTQHLRLLPGLALGGWLLMLALHGAVPFLLAPTLGQAVWSVGFSQSFANQSLWSVYATNFGAPEPAAMAFGLPGAWLAGLYIRLGLHPPDAYTAMVASWMTMAMAAAYKLARHFSVPPNLALLAALGWMSMPVAWAHAGYSMLSIGIALLPMYFFSTLKLLQHCAPVDDVPQGRLSWRALAVVVACILAVFMDGYSFMFFVVGSGLLAACWWLQTSPHGRKRLALVALPVHVLGLSAAYGLYGAFVGQSGYTAAPLDFFRGWGADLSFFFRPTHGMHWLPDLLGWSTVRTEQQYFGDESVWITTFSIPVALAGLWAAWRMKNGKRPVAGLVLIAGFGFYMALGPSIKLNSVKPEGASSDRSMPAEAAIAPTGSAVLSEKLPGFNNMRASYRWTAMGVFGAWALLVLALSVRNPQRTRWIGVSLMIGVVLLNLPYLPKKWAQDAENRRMFFQLDADLIGELRPVLHAKETVAFLPYGNDFLVNYLAARLNFTSFNIGGDKNLEKARTHWPHWMSSFAMGQIDPGFAARAALLLGEKEADAVVFPFVDLLWAAHQWPAARRFQEELQPSIEFLRQSSLFEVTPGRHQVAVRLKDEYLHWPKARLMGRILAAECATSPCGRKVNQSDDSLAKNALLVDGWFAQEPWGRWSEGDEARVLLEVPYPPNGDLELLVNGQAFLIPEKHPDQQVEVFLQGEKIGQLNYSLPADDGPVSKAITIPHKLLPEPAMATEQWILLTFRFKTPQSPASFGLSEDTRRISLGLIDLSLRMKAASSQ